MLVYKNFLVFPLLLFAILFFSCKQVAYKPHRPGSSGSFLPETYGSTWTYRDSIFALVTDSVQVYGPKMDMIQYTMNGQTTDFNGQICYNADGYSQSKGAFTAYYYNYNHLCDLRQPTLLYGLTILDLVVDTASVGYRWSDYPTLNDMLNGYTAQALYTILGRGITMTIKGKVYNNVYHTGVNLQINKGDGYHNIASYDIYSAQGVGLIELDSYVYNSYNETLQLLTYSVNTQ